MGNNITLDTVLENTEHEKSLQKLFKKYDKDKNGFLDEDEFKEYIQEVELFINDLKSKLDKKNVKEGSEISKKLSSKKLEELKFEKFVINEKKKLAIELKESFQKYDINNDGKITFEEFKTKVIETLRIYEKNIKYKKEKPEEIIITKLKKSNKQAQNMPIEELYEWAESLCIESELKEWYLNEEFAKTEQILDKIEKMGEKEKKGLFDLKSGPSETVQMDTKGMDNFQVEDDFEVEEEIDKKQIKEENTKEEFKIGKTVKVKLVIAEICKSNTQKAIRKMLSPILTTFDNNQQFGMFHSALIVGPWYLEWNNSSLCIPRRCYSNAAILAADLEMKGTKTFQIDEIVNKCAKVIIDWNVNRNYSQNKNNCQQFIDELCKELGFDLSLFDGPFGDYLDQIRSKGSCNIEFPLNGELREKLKINESKISFSTHKEIDDFVNSLIENVDREYLENNVKETALLKAFDRAFWLRNFKDPKNEIYIQHNCPFKDPSVTTSIKKDWF